MWILYGRKAIHFLTHFFSLLLHEFKNSHASKKFCHDIFFIDYSFIYFKWRCFRLGNILMSIIMLVPICTLFCLAICQAASPTWTYLKLIKVSILQLNTYVNFLFRKGKNNFIIWKKMQYATPALSNKSSSPCIFFFCKRLNWLPLFIVWN